MKKLLLSLAAVTALWTATQAQTSGGPDLYGYVWRDNTDPNGPAFNWIDLTTKSDASQVFGLTDDDNKGPLNIGFPFHYYWYDVSNYWIGSNGYIGFTSGTLASTATGFASIPSTALPQNYLAPFLADLNLTPYGGANPAQVWRWNNSNNDTLIVSWINTPFWADNSATGTPDFDGSNTFQVIFSAVDSSITFQYFSQVGASASPTNYFTCGIENNAGSDGLMHSHDVYPMANTAVKFYYPHNSTFQVHDVSTSFVDNAESGGLFISKDTTTANAFVLSAEVKNTGNAAVGQFNITANVKNQNNVAQVLVGGGNSSIFSYPFLMPGQTDLIYFTKKWKPSNAGVYTFNCTTSLSGDATPTNNQKSCELRVVDTTTASTRLAFDNGVAAGNGIAWAGGNAGIGVEFPLPYFPCQITTVHVYIAANAGNVGCYIKIYDNSGLNNGPGALLDSVYVDSTAITVGQYNDIVLTTPVMIYGSSVFVGWVMGGNGIGIGQNTVAPFSNRIYEIFGSNWSPYRDRQIEDLMLNITIAAPLNVSAPAIAKDETVLGNFYPNPSGNNVSIRLNSDKNNQRIDYKIYDMKGQLVAASKFISNQGEQKIELPVSHLSNGIYTCLFNVNGKAISRQFNIVK